MKKFCFEKVNGLILPIKSESMNYKYLFLIIIITQFYFPEITAQTNAPKYEFRGVWVATVANIDWPSKPGLSSETQQREAIAILDSLEALGMNAVILQIRPSADALYPSELEPWSRYLTGKSGLAPSPMYDPLKFWIEESHQRNLEFHAWLNPFRVAQKFDEELDSNHIVFQHPDWILQYGNKLYFDPGLPQAREFLIKVVTDIVTRYDLDAIHFDDYFYPYPTSEEFPDTTSFKNYNRAWPLKYKADWRRENVDITIKQLNLAIKKTKPWVKFGISPFGVWRNIADDPNGSNSKAGTSNYDGLYANIIKWQQKGWIDYSLPQLYWHLGHPAVDFTMLAEWWKNHSYGRGMYVGHGIYRVDPGSSIKEWTEPTQLSKQINILRDIPEISGSAFYSSKHFNRDILGFQDTLKMNYYQHPALVPPMPWINNTPPFKPEKFKKRGKKIKWQVLKNTNPADITKRIVIYVNKIGQEFEPSNGENIYKIILPSATKYKFSRRNKKKVKYEIRISALDRLNNESELTQPVKIKL